MAVPTARTDLSATAASNSPQGSDAIGASTGPDDYIRALSSLIRLNYDDILLRATSASPTLTGTVSLSDANLAISGTAKRITADFSATTVANRTMFQNSITNGPTNVGAIPNGTATTSSFQVFADSDATDCVRGTFGTTSGASVSVESSIAGTATYVPLLLKTSGNTQLGIEIDGRVYGSNLHNVGTVTGTTKQYLASGTYTPTITAGTNITSSFPAKAQWTRVGNVVTVSGGLAVTPTATATESSFTISLPIASALAAVEDLNGSGSLYISGANSLGMIIQADAATDTATTSFRSPLTAGACSVTFVFQYEIL